MSIKTLVAAGSLSLFLLIGGAFAGESGEKGGTADINIGVGELAEDEKPATAKERAAQEGKKDKKKHKKAAKKEKKKHKQKHKEKHKKRDASEAAAAKEGNAETTYKVEKGE